MNWSGVIPNGSYSGHFPVRKSKGMKETPKSVCNVSIVRNTGSPKFREGYGDGVLIVVDGVTSIRGDGRAAHRAKQDRQTNL